MYKRVDKKKILTDLQKECETFSHASLLKKLKPTSFYKEAINWLKSHLSKENFRVDIGSL